MVWEDRDPVRHLIMVKEAVHPADEDIRLESSLRFAMVMADELGHEVCRWRREVMKEMKWQVEAMEVELKIWYGQLPQHGKEAYKSAGAVAGCVAWPALRKIGNLMGYPKMDALCAEATSGFKLLREIPAGQGWRKLKQPTPVVPLGWEELRQANAQVMRECENEKPSRESEDLLKEILVERRLGRMWGPFEAPKEWNIDTVALPTGWAEEADMHVPLWKVPKGEHALGAPAFAITQLDADGSVLKIRRGDDWKRSRQNDATVVRDRPGCHHVDFLVDGAKELKRKDKKKRLTVWGHDHDGAYRQLMCENPFWCMCLL